MSTSALERAVPKPTDILDLRPLQPTIGAEIHGIDIGKPLDPAVRDAIRAAVLEYKVVFFRDQDLSPQGHADFARAFGPLYTHPNTRQDEKVASIHKISARDNGRERELNQRRGVRPGEAYHTDTSWRLVPTWGAVLRAVDLPPVGGDTIWVDAHLAYEGLPDAIKQRLEGRHVTHDYRPALNRDGHDYPIVAHPVVRTHRETGKRVLWVNFTQDPQILGLDLAESDTLLDEILLQYKRPEFQVRFNWKPGSVAFWDNRGAVHFAVRNYEDYPRLLDRILIADEALYADL